MQREINVAFQGGGAKLISLIAAAHAIADLERNGELKVKAVSGSSAGAIAAFLLAAGADFDKLRDAVRKSDKQIQTHFPKLTNSKLYRRTMMFSLFGRPIYSEKKFNDIISDILIKIGIDTSKSLKEYVNEKRLYIISSDIYEAKSIAASSDEIILNVLRASCAIPIVFASFNQFGAGQSADGGIFDNMPTDILMSDRGENTPVFAIGFKPEQLAPATSPLSYIYTIASSSIYYRVAQSRRMIGDDMVLDLETSLTTLDFSKIVSVGIDQEYKPIREQTTFFFKPWLGGSGKFSDPMSRNKGQSPYLRLRKTELAIMEYVEGRLHETPCKNDYLKMRVNAHCLSNPNLADEIIVEQLVVFPEGHHVPGISLPMTGGAGVNASLECFVHLDDPNGPEIDFTQLVIHDELPIEDASNSSERRRTRTSAILLLKGDLREYAGRPLYVLKKERRYGFMSDLREKGEDFLSVKSFYWKANVVTIELNVPNSFGAVSTEWLREGVHEGSFPQKINPQNLLVPTNYSCYAAKVTDISIGGNLRGVFKVIPRIVGSSKSDQYVA